MTAGAGLRRHPAGFTLIEILVVMAIVGIVLAVASVNFLRDDRQLLEAEVDRLALLLQLGRDTAAARGEAVAWAGTPSRYGFLRRDETGAWVADGDEFLRERELPAGIRLAALSINHVAAALGERVLFYPTGACVPFEIVLALGERRARIVGNAAGRVEVGKQDGRRDG